MSSKINWGYTPFTAITLVKLKANLTLEAVQELDLEFSDIYFNLKDKVDKYGDRKESDLYFIEGFVPSNKMQKWLSLFKTACIDYKMQKLQEEKDALYIKYHVV
jgi:hypothetical protein